MQDADISTKQTITQAYEAEKFNRVMDEALHPGGLELTARMAEVAGIRSGFRVLDIASGRGTTACFLAETCGCHLVGIDLSAISISLARRKSWLWKISDSTDFLQADAENIPFRDSFFDVVVGECYFSLLTDKESGAMEIARVLKPGGKLVLTDVILSHLISSDLRRSLTFDCCFSGAQTHKGYMDIFAAAGLQCDHFEDHSRSLKKVTYQVITGYGSLSAFWEQFGPRTSPCCPASEGGDSSRKLWLQLFRETKPGYGLFSFGKPE